MNDLHKRIAELSPEKRKLFLRRLNQTQKEARSCNQIRPKSRESNHFPLSFAQQRLWFLNQLDPGNIAYNISQAMHLIGQLNVSVLAQSLNEVVRRHEALRATFAKVAGQPVQVIAPTLTLALPVVDLRALPAAKQEGEIKRLATEKAQQSFNLGRGPLLRVTLLRLSEAEHVVLLTMHHIIADGWSIGVFVKELASLYAAFLHGQSSPLPDLSIQYADFAVWQRQWLQGEVLEAQLAYWKQQLGDSLPRLELPTDYPRPIVQMFRGARQTLVLPKALTEDVKSLSQREGATLFMALLASFQTLLHWYTSQSDVVVGTDVANRNHPETEDLIGFFTNQLVLRTDLSGNPTFEELLLRVREVTLGAYAHQDLPFDKLVEVLNPERNLSRSPLFSVKVILQNMPMPPLTLPGLTVNPLHVNAGKATLDLLLEFVDTEPGLIGSLEYNTDLFNPTSMTRMLGQFETLLYTVVARPEAKLSELFYQLTETDRQQQILDRRQRKEAQQQQLKKVQRKVIHAVMETESVR